MTTRYIDSWTEEAATRYEEDDLTEEEQGVINAVEFWRL